MPHPSCSATAQNGDCTEWPSGSISRPCRQRNPVVASDSWRRCGRMLNFGRPICEKISISLPTLNSIDSMIFNRGVLKRGIPKPMGFNTQMVE